MPKRPQRPNRPLAQPLHDRQWVEVELRTLRLGDRRRDKRVKKILGDFGAQPGASIPRACGDWAGAKAAYRCLGHQDVEAQEILAAHLDTSLARARPQAVVLAVQDTTTLNLSTHPHTTGLGPVANNRDKTIGLFLHSTLLFTEDGQALGLLKTQLYARDPAQFKAGPAGARNRQPIEQKESYRWLQSLDATFQAAALLPQQIFINIADREADIYELFWRLAQMRAGHPPADAPCVDASVAARVELLVRCQHNRTVEGEPEPERLFAHLAQLPVAGSYQVTVPRKPGQKARVATLSLRFAPVSLAAPPDQVKYHGHCEAISLWAILAEEEGPPPGVEPISWRLLSTVPVREVATCILQVQRYTRRWAIEIYHKILKSGCKAEERQLESVERLERCLALDCIVAWRVLGLTKAGRGKSAEEPVSPWLDESEWKALWCLIHQRIDPPDTPPSTAQAVRWIAQLGGFLGRRGDGPPGPMTLWRGLQRLNDFTRAYRLFAKPPKDVGNA